MACDAAALAACLERGIPITFFARTGGPAGVALPFAAEAPRVARLLEELVERPTWRALYADWKRSAERREVLAALRRWPLRPPDLRTSAVAAVFTGELARRFPSARVEESRASVGALLASRIASRLTQGRMGGVIAVLDGMGLHLTADFAAILGWRFYPDCRNWLQTDPEIVAGQWKPRLAALVEAQAGRDDARIQSLWDRFCFSLAGVV